jgi:arsenate reductase
VHPEIFAAMQEIGIDLSAATPKKLTQELANDAALLITMGCGDKCPCVPDLRRDDWPSPIRKAVLGNQAASSLLSLAVSQIAP